jgi:ATP adenylyltransferase
MEAIETGCLFCRLAESTAIIDGNEHAVAFYDKFPVTRDHTLVIPRRHVADYFDLDAQEVGAIHELLKRQQARLMQNDPAITGFNIGVNIGASAGQTVFHVHVHLIPRRSGDMRDPKGGVRGVIPGKQKY